VTENDCSPNRAPLALIRHGKVREVYSVDDESVLLVASDRVSALTW